MQCETVLHNTSNTNKCKTKELHVTDIPCTIRDQKAIFKLRGHNKSSSVPNVYCKNVKSKWDPTEHFSVLPRMDIFLSNAWLLKALDRRFSHIFASSKVDWFNCKLNCYHIFVLLFDKLCFLVMRYKNEITEGNCFNF